MADTNNEKWSRHPLRNVKTKWVFKKGELGLETSCNIYTSKLPIKTLNLYLLTVSGKVYSSTNLDFTTMSGYLAYYPYTEESEQDNYIQDKHHWAKGLIYNTKIEEHEIDLIKANMPNAKYVLDKLLKIGVTGNSAIYDALMMWQKHPELEYMIASEQLKIGLSNRFWKLSEQKQKQVIKWIKDHKTEKNTDLLLVLDSIKGIDPVLRVVAKKYTVPYGVTEKYIHDKYSNGMMDILSDYYSMCKELKKNMKDKYWLMPKDLIAAHSKVMEQLENTKHSETSEDIKKIHKQLLKFDYAEGDYTVTIPKSWSDIKFQADMLHQCLISCAYDKKMVKGECILVFIRCSGKPIATMEIRLENSRGQMVAKIGQFYANEKNRNDCKPTPKIRALGEKWFENYKAA